VKPVSLVLVRFDIRPDQKGWTIFDRLTGETAILGGFVPEGLGHEDADELADLLNTLDVLRRGRAVH
jgi:hypothetical protein